MSNQSLICPSCGATTTNTQTCDFCGNRISTISMTDNGVVKVSEVDMAESSERKKWLQSNRNKFNAEDFSVVKQTINSISGDKLQSVFDASFLNLTCMYILATFSLERIWLGNTFMWILKVASWGFLVPGTIWWIIDLITVKKRTHKHNMQAFSKTVSIL